jgi:hypothetical protein
MAGLAVVLCSVVILSIGFLYKWSKAVGILEQVEIVRAEFDDSLLSTWLFF